MVVGMVVGMVAGDGQGMVTGNGSRNRACGLVDCGVVVES